MSDWFEVIVPLLEKNLEEFHEGILQGRCGHTWQKEQLRLWRESHSQNNSYEATAFNNRINKHNTRCKNGSLLIYPDDSGRSLGSIGAVDCTFTVRPRVSRSVYKAQDINYADDPMYSEYIKAHAWKLSVITSHGIGDGKKLILHVTIHEGGSVSDSTAYSFHQMQKVLPFLVNGCFWLGDNAYLFDQHILPPYGTATIQASIPAVRAGMKEFNVIHSSDRVCAEHGIGLLKQWGIVRGRADMNLFKSKELFVSSIKVCWGLTNFISLSTSS